MICNGPVDGQTDIYDEINVFPRGDIHNAFPEGDMRRFY